MCGMENLPHATLPAATDEPAVPFTPRSAGALSTARVSEALVAGAIEDVLHATADAHPGRAQRRDGWTPERITTFLSALAQCGCVEDAARAAGMTRQGAYALRNRAGGRAFALAWDAAVEQLAHARVADEVRSRALHGCVELIVRDGKVWGERHRFDNRLTMALLTRLDAKRDSRRDEDVDARIVAGEFDQFVAIAARGDVDAAAEFLADAPRRRMDQLRAGAAADAARQLPALRRRPARGDRRLRSRCHRPGRLDRGAGRARPPRRNPRGRGGRGEEEAGDADPASIYMQLAGLVDAEDDEEDEEYAEDEAGEVAAEAEPDGPMATGNFVNFTASELPEAGGADSPMATGNFVNFTPPTERMAAADRAAFNLPADELHAKEKLRT